MEIRQLNTLRAIAALLVVIPHYGAATELITPTFWTNTGQFGVMLFFILSGFLMSYLYLGKSWDGASVRAFVVARFARVVPLYLLVVGLSYGLYQAGWAGIFYDIPNMNSLISHLLLLSGESVLWTIPPEIQFYVLFVGLWWLYQRKQGYLYVAMALITLAIIYLGFPHPKRTVADFEIHTRLARSLPYFFAGAAFGQLYRRWRVPTYLQSGVYVVALLLVPLLFPSIYSAVTGKQHDVWRDTMVLVVMCSVFFAVVFLVPPHSRLLANRAGDFVGMISYSLYLLHIPVLNLLMPWVADYRWLMLPVFVAASLLVAYASFVAIESPARRSLRALMDGQRAKVAVAQRVA